jgi:hypothetical protein
MHCPFIENAKRVTLISVGQKNRDRIDLSVVDIAHHLARHGVKPEIVFVDSEDAPAGPTILAEAEARRSDLVVMGACGHADSANCFWRRNPTHAALFHRSDADLSLKSRDAQQSAPERARQSEDFHLSDEMHTHSAHRKHDEGGHKAPDQ